jgi:myo-inositol-1(or 4)-monophosphatase
VRQKSSSADLVSQIDAEAERAIVEGITAARPHDAILGEEGTDRVGTTGVRWIVDPLDGTANYVTGYPAYAVSIGVEVDEEPAVGVIADSVRGRMYSAHRGGGATCDDRPIRPSERTDLGACLIATGFGYSAELRLAQAEIVPYVLPNVADIRRSGSAAFDLAAVASGIVDGYYEVNLAPWDLAGGRVIALEAGVRVELLPVAGSEHMATIAAPPQLFDPLLTLLRASGLRV